MAAHSVRPARRDDAGALADIERASFPDPWRKADFVDLLAQAGVSCWVVPADRGVAGYIVSRRVVDEAEILNLAVAPAHRRQGVAHALLQHVMTDLAGHGVRAVFLEVRRSNALALALYQRHGFALVGVRRSYYRTPREDAFVLRRRVGGPSETDPSVSQTG